jgi:hypothetical protein
MRSGTCFFDTDYKSLRLRGLARIGELVEYGEDDGAAVADTAPAGGTEGAAGRACSVETSFSRTRTRALRVQLSE